MAANTESKVGSKLRPRAWAAFRACGMVVAAALGATGTAQLLDSTLDEVLTDEIDEQVEEQLEEQLESEISEAIEQQVENAVETTVESAVEQQIENSVVDTITQQVESGVTEAVQDQLESGVAGTITQQLQSTIEQAVEGNLEGIVEQGLGDTVEEGLDEIVDVVGETAGQVVDSGGAGEDSDDDESTPAPTETYAAGIDAVGRAAESETWVILVPSEHIARIESWGFNIRLRRNLDGLDRVLLRVDAPEDRDIAQAALELALDAPGTLVDFNHVYTPGADDDAELADTAVARPQVKAQSRPRPALTVGIVDTAVAATHSAFESADVVQQDFVPFDAPRPLGHGTAVASILVGKGGVLSRARDRARLHAATVFFADGSGNAIATTESLVAALGWHAAEDIDVVNMSLAGPPNRVLEAAIAAAAERGMLVVAAVGNNGPAGEPLYPAAYAHVIGVTAVDSANRIYRYANRGRHVMFAAPGVRVRVADSDGGYAAESGTSMAAPYAAAIIAHAAAKASASNDAVLASLKATAIDLGAASFDDVFGYGLIANIE